MPDQDFELPSGAKLHVSVAPFQDANALTKAILKSMGGVQLSADLMNMDVTVLKDAFIAAATSDEVEKALRPCMARALYDNVKVTDALFDDPQLGDQARRDYLMICKHIIEVNCLPFFDQALSTLKTSLGKKTSSPEQK